MKTLTIETTEQRLDRLEARIAELAAAVERLGPSTPTAPAVLASSAPSVGPAVELDERSAAEPEGEVFSADLIPNTNTILAVLSGLGTSFLVLGGALLIRTITDAGAVPRSAGIAAGFAYALAWILVAVRLAGRGRRIHASFLGVTAVIIGDPLLFEALTRFHAAGPWTAAAGLLVLTGACLVAGRRRDLGGVVWFAALAAAATAAVLSIVTGAVAPFAATLIAIGIATLWLTDGSLAWDLLRWPAAGAADMLVLWMAAALLMAETPARAVDTDRLSVLVFLSLALPLLYVGTFLVRTLVLRRGVRAFEILQTFGSLAVGLGSAVALLRSTGARTAPLAIAAIAAGGACYAAALRFLDRRTDSSRSVSWCAALALALVVFGVSLLLAGPAAAWLFMLLALGAAFGSSRFPVLRLHAAGFAAAAAWHSGLASVSIESLVLRGAVSPEAFSSTAFTTLAVCGACLPMIARSKSVRADVVGAVARTALSVIACLGAAGLLIAFLGGLSGGADPAAIALVRSAVLAAAAVVLAFLARRTSFDELGWLAWAVLVLAGIKLVVEDVPAGRPLTLFLAFALYGASLLSTPRILRRRET
ncbi:MAG TPA: hypothetical protein VE007_01415 [Thermoanaerobaculia bacterium]|nr:hypothetical protein [Thermoanaerobaculia bacterium]